MSEVAKPRYSVHQITTILSRCSKDHDRNLINTLFNCMMDDTARYSESDITLILQAFHKVNLPTTEPR